MFYVLLCFVFLLSSFTIILMGTSELVASLGLSSWCLVAVLCPVSLPRVPWVGMQYVVVVFPDHTHLPFSPAL